MSSRTLKAVLATPFAALAVALAFAGQAAGQQSTIGDICRVQGQEAVTLHGTGIVVGLPGTGDGEGPALAALAQVLTQLGAAPGKLENLNTVAQVYVTAQVNPAGGRAGGRFTTTISATGGAKSLAGGVLLKVALRGPNPGDPTIYANAEGQVTIENSATPTVGRVHGGAQLIQDMPNSFQRNGLVTLVIDSKHAGFAAAQEVEYAINEDKEFAGQTSSAVKLPSGSLAYADDPKTVLVAIPDSYRDSAVLFVSALLSIPLESLPRERRVVINEQAGIIVIGDRVEIQPVAIAHKNLTIDVGGGERQSQFVPLSPGQDTSVESLKSLVDALNSLRVAPKDTIEIIKRIDRAGALYGKLIID